MRMRMKIEKLIGIVKTQGGVAVVFLKNAYSSEFYLSFLITFFLSLLAN